MCLNWNELLSPFLMDADQNFENISKKLCWYEENHHSTRFKHILIFIRLSIYSCHFDKQYDRYKQFLRIFIVLCYLIRIVYLLFQTFYCNLPIHYISLYLVPVCFFLGIKMDEAVDFNLRAFTTQQGSSV